MAQQKFGPYYKASGMAQVCPWTCHYVLFRCLTGNETLSAGRFRVGNFFLPQDTACHQQAVDVVVSTLKEQNFSILLACDVPVNNATIRSTAVR